MTSPFDDPLLAEIRLEFCDGLPERLTIMRAALGSLEDRFDPEQVEIFYRAAHSLKGTAPSFGAHVLVESATALAEVGRGWYEGGSVDDGELETALEDLDRLASAIQKYTAEVKGDGDA